MPPLCSFNKPSFNKVSFDSLQSGHDIEPTTRTNICSSIPALAGSLDDKFGAIEFDTISVLHPN